MLNSSSNYKLFLFSFLVLFLVFNFFLLLSFIFGVPGLSGFFSSQCWCSGVLLLHLVLLLVVTLLLLLN